MQTRFTVEQLCDPETRAADAILRKCVHCGFCNAVCPTFRLTGDELDGPRGRIYLLKDMLESELAPAAAVRHIDRCLSCLACMSTCPSGVNYMHLVDQGRAFIETRHHRPLFERLARAILAATLPYPRRLRALLRAGWMANLFRPLLPAGFQPLVSVLRASSRTAILPALKSHYAPGPPRRGRVALLPGCVQQVLGSETNHATIRLLTRLGFDIEVLNDKTCCGAIEHHLGKRGTALRRIEDNVRDWGARFGNGGIEAIVVNASGCGTMIKDYAHLLRNDAGLGERAAQVSRAAVDITGFLSRLDLAGISTAGARKEPVVVYQNPCSIEHAQHIHDEPVVLLRKFGFEVVEPGDGHTCCGSAGTYNLLQPHMARQLGEQKAEALRKTGAAVIASGNLACALQIGLYLETPVLHTVQLLDWASGGPIPSALFERT